VGRGGPSASGASLVLDSSVLVNELEDIVTHSLTHCFDVSVGHLLTHSLTALYCTALHCTALCQSSIDTQIKYLQ
jgi:hypothetical protein